MDRSNLSCLHRAARPFARESDAGAKKKDAQGLITEAGDMVVYCAGFPAICGRQPLYFHDETFAVRAAIPAPKRSDSLSDLPMSEVEIL